MKYIIILGDGMADNPIPSLGGKTPLQYARKPEMDEMARLGRNGLTNTIPAGFAPGSEIANLAVLGYNLPEVFEGRGSLEAASMGIAIEDNEMAMRCNLITIENGTVLNHSGGQISSEDGAVLMAFLQKELGGDDVNFFPGVSYRNLLKFKGGNKLIDTTPPHDIIGREYARYLVKPHGNEDGTATGDISGNGKEETGGKGNGKSGTDGRNGGKGLLTPEETAERLNYLTLESMKILPRHPLNIERAEKGLPQANCIWAWSPGYRPKMEPLSSRFPQIRKGSVISAVDLIRGIGVYAGLTVVPVEGITGLYDTNYEGKAKAALKALEKEDFVFLHIEASDEAGHDGDPWLKVKTIENLNDRIVRPILETVTTWDEPVSIALLPDHPTPCAIRTHTADPVPFTICRSLGNGRFDEGEGTGKFDEISAKTGSYGLIPASGFMDLFIKGN